MKGGLKKSLVIRKNSPSNKKADLKLNRIQK